jgi:helicase
MGWSRGENLSGLESRYQCYAGTIMALTEEVSWLVDAAAEIAEVMGWTSSAQLADLAERVRLGVEADCLELARAHVPGLSREDIKALVAAGFNSVTALRQASPEVLQRYLSAQQVGTLRAATGSVF